LGKTQEFEFLELSKSQHFMGPVN